MIKLPEEHISGINIAKISESLNTTPSTTHSGRLRKKASSLRNNMPPAAPSSRSSIQFPIIPGFVDKNDPQIEYGTLNNGSIRSSNESVDKSWSPAQNPKEDLYAWMAKQQHDSTREIKAEKFSDLNRSNTPVLQNVQPVNEYMQNTVRLLDAHLIFEPLLTCLGVMPQQINSINSKDVTPLENLGTNLSLVCAFDTMRIDIVVSEAGADKKPKTKIAKKTNGKFSLQISTDTPAFLCERIGIELEVLKMADGLPDEANQNLLYFSRGQLKKHTSTVINFSLNVRYISQQVNMPLLRLLHQITNMYQNVKEAQNELREQPDLNKRHIPLKDESSLASEMCDNTLVGSNHEPQMDIFDYSDERYDKFNETIPLGHSVSRTKMPPLGPLIPAPGVRNRPQSFAQKLRSTSKTVKGKLGYTNLNETVPTPIKNSPTTLTNIEQSFQKAALEPKTSLTGAVSSNFEGKIYLNKGI